ncbi:unnamed protein product [Diabrotica balteata]|uniref:Uncharacterized protein n=1 Tax=Diabrotica balteata TaxID=107213 RepID=A0A9P0DTW0_DIABA|nr:unnamed protein product [Diabrotica balteata]
MATRNMIRVVRRFSRLNILPRVKKKQGGVAIYVKENLMYSSLNLNEYNVEQSSEFCAIYVPSIKTNILTVYRSGGGTKVPIIKPQDERILAIMGPQLDPIENMYDSNNIPDVIYQDDKDSSQGGCLATKTPKIKKKSTESDDLMDLKKKVQLRKLEILEIVKEKEIVELEIKKIQLEIKKLIWKLKKKTY